MNIASLIPTQDGYRPANKMAKMVDFVRNGGVYSEEVIKAFDPDRPLLIAINQFEDGRLYVRDGLHRLTSIFLAGRLDLYPSEYVIEHYTYKRYCSVNLDIGWTTPFDPRTHVRLPNFSEFRNEVNVLIQNGQDPSEFIFSNTDKYLLPRKSYHDNIDRLTRHFFPKLWAAAA